MAVYQINNSLCKWLDIRNDTRTTFIQDEDDRLARSSKSLDEITLILREIEVCEITWSLGV